MKDPRAAALAVAKDRTKFMGRPLKIYYCPPRDGVQWPPPPEHDRGNFNNLAAGASSSSSGGSTDIKGANSAPDGPVDPRTIGRGYSQRPKTPKPPGCKKLYAGNLSYTIDDDTIVDFLRNVAKWWVFAGSLIETLVTFEDADSWNSAIQMKQTKQCC